MEGFDFWKLLAGLGMFLFGMYQLEDAVKTLSGKFFRRMISLWTRSNWRAVGSGTLVTAILQSSSAVSLMVLAFVGAGVMSMETGIGVMLGSNIGTTCTAWIVALLGFKLKIESFALPFIAGGGLLLVFSASGSRFFQVARLLLGFGFLFLGLDYMKGGVENLAAGFDFRQLPDYGIWVYVLVGVVLTALMQSSSASIAIALAALHSGLITFTMGAALIIGANVGTTITVLLGAMGGTQAKKRVGVSHLVFNGVTAIFACVGLALLVNLVGMILPGDAEGVTGLALFHTLFNVIGVILFFPFIGLLARLLNGLFPDYKTVLTVYLNNTPVEEVEAADAALRKEIRHLLSECQLYQLRLLKIDEKLIFRESLPLEMKSGKRLIQEKLYEDIKLLHAEIFSFYTRLQSQKMEVGESKELERKIYASRNIMNALKNFKGIRGDLDEFDASDNVFIEAQYRIFRQRLSELCLDLNRLPDLENPEEFVRELLKAYLRVETADRRFIKETMQAVTTRKIHEMEIASLLLANRLFTQACRLQVFGLKDLLLTHAQAGDFDRAMDVKELVDEEQTKSSKGD
ncbi:MAG: Na/Pi symporter [Proteobacteria bacterium]|nr:Na/Pi cotransporter family protein [Desulfobulbaceae bacterium]MBU4153828.1 Na/Pi symporter [Pseudomonadota bacterium]